MGIWHIPDYLEEIDGILHMDGTDVVELAQQHGTPLFVFSEQRIRHNVEEIKTAFQDASPPTRVFYASKANSNMAVLQIIRDTGIDIEVNSGGELYKALRAGFRPDQIILNGVAKTEREIREAVAHQIFSINVDSLYELERILEIAQDLNTIANIALRMVPGVKTGAHGGLETGTHKSKAGISMEELPSCYSQVLEHPNHLALIGLHMHIGSQTTDHEKYKAGFKALVKKGIELYETERHLVSHLNMGGGFPVPFIKVGDEYLRQMIVSDPTHPLGDVYSMLRAKLTPKDIAAATTGQLENEKFWSDLEGNEEFRKVLPDTCFILEPGRRVVADAAVLLTTIQNRKERKERSTAGDTWLLLDAGFNTLIEAFDYNWYFHAIAANKANKCVDHPYKLGGPLCDSGDVFHDSEHLDRLPDYRMLPGDMKPGDLLAFLDVGAYTLEQMFPYNGQPRAAALLIRESGDVQVIRRRDTYEDLVSHDILLDG